MIAKAKAQQKSPGINSVVPVAVDGPNITIRKFKFNLGNSTTTN